MSSAWPDSHPSSVARSLADTAGDAADSRPSSVVRSLADTADDASLDRPILSV